jgi:hypothetical protein
VRAHQNRRFWFGEEVLNARAAIGGDGVKIGSTEYDAREVYADEIADRLASSDACESEQDLSSKGFEIEVVQRLECHHRKRFRSSVSTNWFASLRISTSKQSVAPSPRIHEMDRKCARALSRAISG